MGNALCCTSNQDLAGMGKPEYFDFIENAGANKTQDQIGASDEVQQ